MDHDFGYDFAYYQMHYAFRIGYLISPNLSGGEFGDDFFLYSMGWEL